MSTADTDIRVITAGAGSGKTRRITEEITRAISDEGIAPEKIIATTFTRKAAAELSARIRSSLVAGGHIEEAMSMGAAMIGTVHSVCGQLLERYCYETGIAPGTGVLGEQESQALLEEAIGEAAGGEEIETLEHLAYLLGHTEYTFGGQVHDWGSDVRKMIELARSNDLSGADIVSHAEQSAIELIELMPAEETRWEALRRRIRDEAERALGDFDPEDSTAKTKKVKNTLQAMFSTFDREGTVRWKDIEKLATLDPGRKSEDAVETLKAAAGEFSGTERYKEDVRSYIRTAGAVAARTLEILSRKKRELGVMDFVDQEAGMLRALDSQAVRERVSGEFSLLVVDEFQDTSPIQLSIFMKLADAGLRSIWVGDPKQSIYGFREADPALMQALLSSLPGRSVSDSLDTSYRSRPDLVNFSNALFTRAFAQTMPEVNVALEAARDDHSPDQPAVQLWIYPYSKNRTKQEYFHQALAAGIGELIEARVPVENRNAGEAGGQHPVEAGDIAVLCRTWSRAASLSRALEAAGIPAVMQRPGLLFTPEGVAVHAALRYLADRRDSLAVVEMLMLAREEADPASVVEERIHHVKAEEYESWAGDEPLVAMLESLRPQLHHYSLPALFDVITARGNLGRLIGSFGDPGRVDANLERLRGMVEEYSESMLRLGRETSIAGLAAYLEKTADEKTDSQAVRHTEGAVQVSTYHGAKGLEWPVVIAADLNNEATPALFTTEIRDSGSFSPADPLAGRSIRFWPLLPTGKSGVVAECIKASPIYHRRELADEAEHHRLLYVGLTRARDYLILPADQNAQGELKTKWIAGAYGAQGDNLELPQNPGIHDAVVEWNGRSVPVHVKELSLHEGRAGARRPAVVRVPSENRGPADYPPYIIRPSGFHEAAGRAAEAKGETHEEASGEADVEGALPLAPGNVVTYGRDLSAGAGDFGTDLGEACHAVFARSIGCRRRLSEDEVSRMLAAYGAGSSISAGLLAEQAESFRLWTGEAWPEAAPDIEVSGFAVVGGRRVTARLDLVMDSGDELVIVDHKTVGTIEDPAEAAQEYAGQLSLYRLVAEKAQSGRRVRTLVNFVLQGTVVELEGGEI